MFPRDLPPSKNSLTSISVHASLSYNWTVRFINRQEENEYLRSLAMNCCLRYMRYTEIPITLTPKISFLYLLQIVTACDIKSNTVFLIKNAEKNVVLYCLVDTINSEEIAFQT